MDMQQPLVTGSSEIRSKTARKPRSATSLQEFVSSFQPISTSREVEYQNSYSLQEAPKEGDALETDATLKTHDSARTSEEEMNTGKRRQLAGRQILQKENDVKVRERTSKSFEGFKQKNFEKSLSKRAYEKERKSTGEPTDRKDYTGSVEGKRSERYMKDLLNREDNPESTGREKLDSTKSRNERSETVRKADSSARALHRQREFDQGQVEKNDKKGSLQAAAGPTKLKLKVGGITHTLQTLLPAEKVDPKKNAKIHQALKPEVKKRRQRLILQGISDDEDTDVPTVEKPRERLTESLTSSSLRKVEHKGACSRGYSSFKNMSSSRPQCDGHHDTSSSGQALRKSSRVVKRRMFDVEENDVPETERKRKRKFKGDEDDLYKDEDEKNAASSEAEASSDADLDNLDDDEDDTRKTLRKVAGQSRQVTVKKKKAPLTARQRVLQSSKEGDLDFGTSLIEFPDGLPSSVPRKQNVKLTEEEAQAKKTEAARRRKQQMEKAAKDVQALAIHKILSQDSVRKKREDRLQKQREEIAQSKRAAELEAASNSIRWTLGPNGTVVSWSKDIELPTLFNCGPCSYPPPREKCAVPTCSNTYKYRHSKLKLPICSLQCYRIVETPNEIGSAF